MRKKEERHIRELEFRENVRVFNVYFNFETIESFTLSLSHTHMVLLDKFWSGHDEISMDLLSQNQTRVM